MIAIPVIKVNQSNTAPTESQLKLAISQVLSLPTAYNAPVIVLDFNVGDDGLVTGRFRDAARPRVFTYEIDDDGIAFKPFTPGRMDSLNVTIWESFSEGYTYRIDAVANKSKSRRQCVKPTAYNCGKSCININKTCKVNPKDANSSMRRKRLKAIAEEFKKSQKITSGGGGSISELKPEPVKLLTENKLTPKPPEEPPFSEKKAGAKYLEDPSTNQFMRRHKGVIEITRAIDENNGVVDTGLREDGSRGSTPSGAIKWGEVKVLKLNKPGKQTPMGTASVIDPFGKRSVIDLSVLADGVKEELIRKSSKINTENFITKPKQAEGKAQSTLNSKANEPDKVDKQVSSSIDQDTPEKKALLEAEDKIKNTSKSLPANYQNALHDKDIAVVDYLFKTTIKNPTKNQVEYDLSQPEMNLESGTGMKEGWRSPKGKAVWNLAGRKEPVSLDNDIVGIPWEIESHGNKKVIITGAKVPDRQGNESKRKLVLYGSQGEEQNFFFPVGDREQLARAKRLVKEISQGKSQRTDRDGIEAMIKGGIDGYKKYEDKKIQEIKDREARDNDWNNFLKEENYTKEEYQKLNQWKQYAMVNRFENKK